MQRGLEVDLLHNSSTQDALCEQDIENEEYLY